MDITEVTVVHHAALVLAALWAAATTGWTHPALFLVAIVYIFAESTPSRINNLLHILLNNKNAA